MEILRHPLSLPPSLRGSVAALGNFDGFHRGHQVVVGEAGRLARDMGVPLAVVTTEPHPRSFFRPNDPPFRLTPFRERAWLLEQFGVDLLVSLPFDATLSHFPPQQFVTEILCEKLGVLHLLAGYDYRFGAKRAGGSDLLAWMGKMEGFGLSVVEPVTFGIEGAAGQIYSSSLVRDTLREGRARRAASLLGHWWTLSGHVQEGDKRGRTIGFPTANLALEDVLHPKFGVYAVRVTVEGDDAIYGGVANLGCRPTFDKQDVTLETFLFDFEGDLYGRHIRVEFVGFVRAEQKFSGIEELKAQIAQDCQTARTLLSDPENARDHLPPPRLDRYLADHPVALAKPR
ncbi:bifunctional riboflavin kinase/FAD synthetase [Iodidimonas muriae]|uniref:bifunctional riboflavin kinase/FAD synthetase n=1 Tax=Iodidimonas muriae TaxID=261467 RepID=UPI001E636ABF|nr:bifunctional riboflavin kinase/FAD synthetase [Iodidimonas muriae]